MSTSSIPISSLHRRCSALVAAAPGARTRRRSLVVAPRADCHERDRRSARAVVVDDQRVRERILRGRRAGRQPQLDGVLHDFTNAADLSGYVSLDKRPLSSWMMGLSGRVFGFSSLSMLLPSALCGIAAVVLLHNLVRRTLRASRCAPGRADPGVLAGERGDGPLQQSRRAARTAAGG